MYSYLSDISTPETRTTRIAMMDAGFSAAMAIGIGGGGKRFIKFGYELKGKHELHI